MSAICVFFLLTLGISAFANELPEKSTRDGRLFNVFSIVRFKNEPCNGTLNILGTCYTSAECTQLGGTANGECASGFGVCCSFEIGCGATTNQNNTYFTSSITDSSPCTARVCRCNSNICQLRLDFQNFDIAQPNSDERLDMRAVPRTQCLDATFTATSKGGNPPVICGTNSGYHMILEAEMPCNKLNFDWFENTPRQWRILVTQVPCNSPYKAPQGCTQYFTGTSGTVESYNFQGGTHLANQDYLNCIRTELGFCRIEWSHSPTDFSISADIPNGSNGDNCSIDYVGIVGGFLPGNDPFNQPNNDRFCGAALMAGNSKVVNTISSIQIPFGLRFVTDLGETDDVDDLQGGFKLNYQQIPC